jgi:hypothetical protein
MACPDLPRTPDIIRIQSSGIRIRNLAQRPSLARHFVLGAEASGANVDFSLPSLYHNRSSLDIGEPASEGMLLGMAYVVPKLSLFAANLTLHKSSPAY